MIKVHNSVFAALGMTALIGIVFAQSSQTGRAAGGPVAVQINGTPTVVNANDPGKQPVQFQLSASGANPATDTFVVPAGKELVIDFISAQNTQYPSGGYAYAYLITSVGGNQAYWKIIPPQASTLPINQQVCIYADPGTTVVGEAVQSSGTTSGALFNVSGHYVNVP